MGQLRGCSEPSPLKPHMRSSGGKPVTIGQGNVNHRRLTCPQSETFLQPHPVAQPSPHEIISRNFEMAQATSIAVPGQLLGPLSEYQPGPGTHVHNSNLFASILGPVRKLNPPKPAGPQKRLTKITPAAPVALPTLSIERNISASTQHGGSKGKAEILPEVTSTVLCRVTRITPRQAQVAILVVGETVLDGEWQGLIRVQDVRATEKDKVKIFESFRPGDIVRAVVVSYTCVLIGNKVLTLVLDLPW